MMRKILILLMIAMSTSTGKLKELLESILWRLRIILRGELHYQTSGKGPRLLYILFVGTLLLVPGKSQRSRKLPQIWKKLGFPSHILVVRLESFCCCDEYNLQFLNRFKVKGPIQQELAVCSCEGFLCFLISNCYDVEKNHLISVKTSCMKIRR